jgi:hypothetical protein
MARLSTASLSEPARPLEAATRLARVDESLAAALRGDAAGPPHGFSPEGWLARAEYHGLLPLLDAQVDGDGEPWRARLTQIVRQMAAVDLVREAELRHALGALHAAGIPVLLLKGVHLAYAWYPRPDLRPRVDSDILIAPDACPAVDAVLTDLGYRQPGHTTGELLSYQTPYEKTRDGLQIHVFDVHWRVANAQAFGDLLPYDEMLRDSVGVPRLCPAARGPSLVHALILACTHRVAHHFDSNRLIWLYDIHRLASAMSVDDWERFLSLAERWRVVRVCHRSLERAVSCFATVLPDLVAARLQTAAPFESTAVYAGPPRRHIANVVSDLQALDGWRDRLRLVRQHVFPPPEYMRAVYAGSSRAPLPVLYARRIVRGARRWLVKPRDEWFTAR